MTASRKSRGPSPTARTLAECRRRGWIAQVVERRLPRMFVTQDLFGCIDVVAVALVAQGPNSARRRVIGIQVCAGTDHAKRRAKVLAEPRIRQWLEAGAHMEIWSWAKQGKAGARKLWTLRVEPLTLDEFATTEAA